MKEFNLGTDIQYCRGVGPVRAEAFRKMGVNNVLDLLRHYPRDYIFAVHRSIADLQPDEFTVIKGTVNNVKRESYGAVSAIIADDTCSIRCTWFNMPHMGRVLRKYATISVWGKVSLFKGKPQFTNPSYSFNAVGVPQDNGGGTPIYPASLTLPSRTIENVIKQVLTHVDRSPFYNEDEAWESTLRQRGFIRLNEAMRYIHQPPSKMALKLAKKRLVYEEFKAIAVRMECKRRQQTSYQSSCLRWGTEIHRRIENALKVSPTCDQKKVIRSIIEDTCKPHETPMYRLIQGDVGCGKTVVALYAALLFAVNKKQTVIMCPTKVLARQHYDDIYSVLSDSQYNVCLLTNESNSPTLRDHIWHGSVDIIVATTSVLSDSIEFKDLDLLVVDEEHRFGVKQKEELVKKYKPHQLFMSATPIPKMLTATAFGDLDVSTIEEMPTGRGKRSTYLVLPQFAENMWDSIFREIDRGGQVYCVYPRIEDLEKAWDYMTWCGDMTIGKIHGKLSDAENADAIDKFRKGLYNVLMCTSMVEVGVHVGNANSMVIHKADMFGLSQLHQLRGRIGRGSENSHCFLMCDTDNEASIERLKFLEGCDDGFAVAEKDLELRGPGELLGTMQHGMPELKLADLISDYKLLLMARKDVMNA